MLDLDRMHASHCHSSYLVNKWFFYPMQLRAMKWKHSFSIDTLNSTIRTLHEMKESKKLGEQVTMLALIIGVCKALTVLTIKHCNTTEILWMKITNHRSIIWIINEWVGLFAKKKKKNIYYENNVPLFVFDSFYEK